MLRTAGAQGESRALTGTIWLNGSRVLGPADFASNRTELRVPVAMAVANTLIVELEAAPGAEVTVTVEAIFKPGYGRVGDEGGTLVSSDGLAHAIVSPGLQSSSLVSLQLVQPASDLEQASRVTGTYEFRMWSAAPQQASGSTRFSAPKTRDGEHGLALLTNATAPSPFWTDQTPVQLQLAPTSQIGTSAFAVASVTGLQVSDVMPAQLSAGQVLVNFLGVVDGFAQAVTGYASRFTSDCTAEYELAPASASTKVPVIWIHGWQIQYQTCQTWKGAAAPFLPRFDPTEQGTTFFANWDSTLKAEAQMYRFSYPTFASVDLAAASLATKLKTYVSPLKPAVIVAHSMGGLVARGAVERYGAAPYVRAIITLGTPHQGSPLAVPGFISYAARRSAVLDMCQLLVDTCATAFQEATLLIDAALGTEGAADLRPQGYASSLAMLPQIHYDFGTAAWGAGLPDIFAGLKYACWGYYIDCIGARIGELALRLGGYSCNDGIVPCASTTNNLTVFPPSSIGLGVAPAHHFALANGMPEGNTADAFLHSVVTTVHWEIGDCAGGDWLACVAKYSSTSAIADAIAGVGASYDQLSSSPKPVVRTRGPTGDSHILKR